MESWARKIARPADCRSPCPQAPSQTTDPRTELGRSAGRSAGARRGDSGAANRCGKMHGLRKMKKKFRIDHVEILNAEQASCLRRLARAERKKEKERLLASTFQDVPDALNANLSAAKMLDSIPHEEQVSPLLPTATTANRHEEGMALLELAYLEGKPVLVHFAGYGISKAFESDLRQMAKQRGWKLRLHRLVGNDAIVELCQSPTRSE